MTRAEHLSWCKERAIEYVDQSDFSNAVASMTSDLGKHEETRASVGLAATLGMGFLMKGTDKKEMTRYVQGFN